MNALPFPRSYWADPGLLLAGCYPGDRNPKLAEEKLRGLLECGVRTVINLTEEFETNHRDQAFEPYDETLRRLAETMNIAATCLRHPVRDMGIPSERRMGEIVASIDESIGRDDAVYVHCWGGKGRTGTVVGVHLIRRGLATADEFVETIAKLRTHDPGRGNSPETRGQIEFVRQYVRDCR